MRQELIEEEFKNIFKKDPTKAANDLKSIIEEQLGSLPFVAECMSRRPEIFIYHLGTAKDIYLSPKHIPLKWAELMSVGIAFAMKNEYCAKVHMKNAYKAGATIEEIWDAMLIANIMAITNINSLACRLIKELEEEKKDEPVR